MSDNVFIEFEVILYDGGLSLNHLLLQQFLLLLIISDYFVELSSMAQLHLSHLQTIATYLCLSLYDLLLQKSLRLLALSLNCLQLLRISSLHFDYFEVFLADLGLSLDEFDL